MKTLSVLVVLVICVSVVQGILPFRRPRFVIGSQYRPDAVPGSTGFHRQVNFGGMFRRGHSVQPHYRRRYLDDDYGRRALFRPSRGFHVGNMLRPTFSRRITYRYRDDDDVNNFWRRSRMFGRRRFGRNMLGRTHFGRRRSGVRGYRMLGYQNDNNYDNDDVFSYRTRYRPRNIISGRYRPYRGYYEDDD